MQSTWKEEAKMEKTDDNRILISSIFIMSLLVANVVAGKVVDLFGFISSGCRSSLCYHFPMHGRGGRNMGERGSQ